MCSSCALSSSIFQSSSAKPRALVYCSLSHAADAAERLELLALLLRELLLLSCRRRSAARHVVVDGLHVVGHLRSGRACAPRLSARAWAGTIAGREKPASARTKAARSPRPARASPAIRPCAAGRRGCAGSWRARACRGSAARRRSPRPARAAPGSASLARSATSGATPSPSATGSRETSSLEAQRSSRKATKVSWRWPSSCGLQMPISTARA